MKFFKKLRRRRELDRDLEDELAFHLEQSGRARFGNAMAIKETCREMWTFTTIESCWQDLRYAARTLSNTKGVTGTAIVALALGIGINTMVFTVVSRALHLDLGVKEMERLVVINVEAARHNEIAALLPELRRTRLTSIDLLAAYRVSSMNVSDGAHLPERYWGTQMTASGFDILSRQPALGRTFGPADELPGAVPVAVISHRLWRDRYGQDPKIAGRVIRVDDVPRTVIGVMPEGVMVPEDVDFWIPLDARSPNPAAVFARLAPGKKVGAARAEMESITRVLIAKNPQQLPGLVADVHLLLDDYGRYASRPLFFAMLTAVAFVLLIACADVANLLLGRAAARGREISIRIAIGAGRGRIIRQLLIESVLLASLGGVFGWIVAAGTLRWFDRVTLQAGRPPWVDFSMDVRTFVYLACLSLGTGLLFGLAPALRLAKLDVNGGVKEAGSAHGRRLADLLVAFEMLLAVVLLTGAGLLIRSSLYVYTVPIGVNAANVLTAHINLPEAKYRSADDEVAFFRQLEPRLRALAGVESVAVASAIPTWNNGMLRLAGEIEGGTQIRATGIAVERDYFRVMQVAPAHGRLMDERSKDEVVINAALAAKYWPGLDPLGKRLRWDGGEWMNVVGVIPNIRQDGRSWQELPLVYIPYAATPQRFVFVVARTAVPPETLAQAFRREVQAIDENLPLNDARTLESRISEKQMDTGSITIPFTIFAVVALILAAVGLYAMIAQGVAQRTREIGVRMALGGSRRNILWLVLAQGLWPVAIGVMLGAPAAFGLTRALRAALVGVTPGDPVTFAGVVVVLAAVGALGCVVPARRALRVDPVVALRYE